MEEQRKQIKKEILVVLNGATSATVKRDFDQYARFLDFNGALQPQTIEAKKLFERSAQNIVEPSKLLDLGRLLTNLELAYTETTDLPSTASSAVATATADTGPHQSSRRQKASSLTNLIRQAMNKKQRTTSPRQKPSDTESIDEKLRKDRDEVWNMEKMARKNSLLKAEEPDLRSYVDILHRLNEHYQEVTVTDRTLSDFLRDRRRILSNIQKCIAECWCGQDAPYYRANQFPMISAKQYRCPHPKCRCLVAASK